jgi:pimeloyl-ACP methyl ester carboxylesterase
MLDGPNSDALNWKRLMPDLTASYRVFTVDVIGQPNLSSPVRPQIKEADYGWWLADVLDGLGLEKTHMVGEMGGCWPIFKLATLQPQRIQSATLITPYGLIPPNLHNVRLIPILYELLSLVLPTRANMIRYYRQITTANSKKPKAQIEEVVDTIRLRRRYYNLQASSEFFTPEELAKLTTPTLLLIGNETVFYQPEKMVEHALKVFPGLWGAEIVPEAGGSVTHDRPDWLAQRLASFWTQILETTPTKEWHLTSHK